MHNKKIFLIVIITILLIAFSFLLFNFFGIKDKVATEFMIYVANMNNGPVKNIFVSYINRNTHSIFLIPSLKLILDMKGRREKAGILSHNHFLAHPLRPEIVQAMLKNLNNSDPNIRHIILHYIRYTQSPEVRDTIMETAIKDSDPKIQEFAIHSIGFVKDPSVKDFLLHELENGTVGKKRRATDALCILIDEKVLRIDKKLENKFLNIINDTKKDSYIRSSLLSSLYVITPQRAVSIALPFLNDNDQSVRLEAISLIGHCGKKEDIDIITKLLYSKDPDVANATREAIEQIKRKTGENQVE